MLIWLDPHPVPGTAAAATIRYPVYVSLVPTACACCPRRQPLSHLPSPAARGKPKPSKEEPLVPGLPSKNDVALAAAKRLAGV